MNVRKVTLIVKGDLTAKGDVVFFGGAEPYIDLNKLDQVHYDLEGKPYVWDTSHASIYDGDVEVSGNITIEDWTLTTGDVIAYG